jgi:hypothetical protein
MVDTIRYLAPPVSYSFSGEIDNLTLTTSIKDKVYVLKLNLKDESKLVDVVKHYRYSDEILNFHFIDEESLIVIGKSNKKVELLKNYEKSLE